MLQKLVPPLHPRTGDAELDKLLKPARFYTHPNAILVDQRLSPSEKRAMLASWASDECAVDSIPALRAAPWSPALATFDDVMEALQTLDRNTERTSLNRGEQAGESGNSARS